MILKNNADQKELTENPPTIASHIRMISAFITSRKRPKVRIVIGRVNKIIKGLMNKLSKLKTMATQMEFIKSVTLTPGKILANNITNKAVTRILINNGIFHELMRFLLHKVKQLFKISKTRVQML